MSQYQHIQAFLKNAKLDYNYSYDNEILQATDVQKPLSLANKLYLDRFVLLDHKITSAILL